MKSRLDELREYLMNTCPFTQDKPNPKIFAHLRGISGYDYLMCDFENTYGYGLIIFDDYNLHNGLKSDYGGFDIETLIRDHVVILYHSKYIGKKINKVIKMINKSAK